jgi:hypothetical protein
MCRKTKVEELEGERALAALPNWLRDITRIDCEVTVNEMETRGMSAWPIILAVSGSSIGECELVCVGDVRPVPFTPGGDPPRRVARPQRNHSLLAHS